MATDVFRLPRITRLHHGCSPRATPGATDRELLPIVHGPTGLLCKYTFHPVLGGGRTPARGEKGGETLALLGVSCPGL